MEKQRVKEVISERDEYLSDYNSKHDFIREQFPKLRFICDEYKETIIYIGEFKNGDWNGKGKQFDEKGRLEFKGEFRERKKWNGKYINYHFNGTISVDKYLEGKLIHEEN